MKLLIVVVITIAFQNCNRANISGESHLNSGNGNGEGFGGLTSRYAYFDPANACTDLDSSGHPLPNREIFTFLQQSSQLVRDNCLDLKQPQALLASDIQTGANGSLVYQGQTFTNESYGDFSVLAATCPTGLNPLPSPNRVNLILDSQNISSANWILDTGIAAALSGSMGSLPNFLIQRNNSSDLDAWRGAYQTLTLAGGKTYAFSFYAKPGSVNNVLFNTANNGNVFILQLTFDLTNGTSQVIYNPGGVVVSSMSRAFDGGYFNTVYFTAPANAGFVRIGIAPYSAPYFGSLGDSINATAVQLEDVSTYCQ